MSEEKANPQTPEPVREGIIDRLKAANTPAVVLALVTEFRTFKNASDKTKRRFLKVLFNKQKNAADDIKEEIRQAAQVLKSSLRV